MSGHFARVQQRRSLVFVLALHTLIILVAMRCTYLSLIWSMAYSVGEGAWMDAQWERTDPFQKKRQATYKTWKLSNLPTSVLTVREEESFESSLGWLSLQLQLFSVHVNRKLWSWSWSSIWLCRTSFWRGVALGLHVKDSLVICWDMNCFEGELILAVLSSGLHWTDFESEKDPLEQRYPTA